MVNRQKHLIEVVNHTGRVSIHDLSKIFPDVSEMTIRRDLETLEKEGKLIRIHGGAKSISSVIKPDELYEIREITNPDKKRQIAEKATRFISNGCTIYLDAGTTATELACLLPDIDMRVFTDNIVAALNLAKHSNINTMLLGGTVDSRDMATRSSDASTCWADVNFNYIFLGATGYSESGGFTSGNNEFEYLLKRNLIKKAEKTVILLDSSKIGRSSCYTFANLDSVDIVVSDDELSTDIKQFFEENGIEVI